MGDWTINHHGEISIFISETGNDDYNFLVALHELIEVWLCKRSGITQGDVDNFDMDYEKFRLLGDTSEPGDDYKAPYRDKHCIATGIERMLCGIMKIPWVVYEETLENL